MSRLWSFPSRREGVRSARFSRRYSMSLAAMAFLTATVTLSVILSSTSAFAQYPGGDSPPYSGGYSPPGGDAPPPPGGDSPPPPGGDSPPPPGEETPPLPGDGEEAPADYSGQYGVPHVSGSWTRDDPLFTVTYWTPTVKTVQEQWNSFETYDHTVPAGDGFRTGESGCGNIMGDVTYTFQYVEDNWVMTNVWGMHHDVIDSIVEQVDILGDPVKQYVFQQTHTDTNETLFVGTAADLTPGNVTECQIEYQTVKFTQGANFDPNGDQYTRWEYLDISAIECMTGFEEVWGELPGGVVVIVRTDYWIEYDSNGKAIQRQSVTTYTE